MLCCTSKLAHRITKRHLEACFFIVSWNFPVTQLWEQVCVQRASGPSINQTRVRGCLCGGQCVSVWFFDVACVKTFEIQHCDSSREHIYGEPDLFCSETLGFSDNGNEKLEN